MQVLNKVSDGFASVGSAIVPSPGNRHINAKGRTVGSRQHGPQATSYTGTDTELQTGDQGLLRFLMLRQRIQTSAGANMGYEDTRELAHRRDDVRFEPEDFALLQHEPPAPPGLYVLPCN